MPPSVNFFLSDCILILILVLLGNFLHNHYREATHVIRTLEAELSVIKSELNLNDGDFVKFYDDEKLYLDALKQPPIRDRLCIRYVEVLDDLELCR